MRVEASFHERLSAGLFQETGCGLQPVHFISRTMTDTEKRYSQTEKDALSVSTLGEEQVQHLPPWSTKIQDHHCPQATAPTA